MARLRQPDPLTTECDAAWRLAASGRLRQAATKLEAAIRNHPGEAAPHHMLGEVSRRQGLLQKSVFHLRHAVRLQPDNLEPALDLIAGLGLLRRLDEATEVADRAATRFPDRAEIPTQLGVALATAGQLDAAQRRLEAALAIAPEQPLALHNLAKLAEAQGRHERALNLYRRARLADRDGRLPATNLGDLELRIGAVADAVRSHEAWLATHPGDPVTMVSRLWAAQYESGMTAARLLDLHREWGRRFDAAMPPAASPARACSEVARRLRVGFVSGDFRAHPVGYFTVRAFESFDFAGIDSVLYSGIPADDGIARRLRQAAGQWRDTEGWTDARLAAEVRRDRVDVLIDLAGHTLHSRLGAFAQRPAPLQATWAGYPGTTGLRAMDALICDRFVVPSGEEDCYVETVVRLPDGFLCYDPPGSAPPVAPLPAGDHAPLTFGAFHHPAKINCDVARLWAQVLRAQPGAVVRFMYRGYELPEVRARIRGWFAEHAIGPERVAFEGAVPIEEYFVRMRDIDVMLDPFPFSGGTVTCDALWMGVPVVTMPGRTFASRHSTSHLSVVGLADLIARDGERYVAIVGALADDRARLRDLRAGLRARVAASPLCDGARFAANFAEALRAAQRLRGAA